MSNKTRFSLMVNFIEKYIRELKWSGDETDQERTLAAGNIRAFAGAVCKFLQPDYDRIEELEAENRIFRDTESVDDSVWDALLEQVRLHQERIRELEATIERVRELPDRWRSGTLLRGHWINYNTHDECADELEKELNDE